MKHTIITIAALAVSCAPLLGVTAIENELAQLQAQHTKALAAAAEPVNRRHITALEMLQRKATQASELEVALQIKAELAKLGAPVTKVNPPLAPGVINFSKALAGTKWVWFQKETVTFRMNGNIDWNGSREPWSWKVEDAEQRVISGYAVHIRKKFTITFDANLQTGVIRGEDGERKTRNVTKQS